MYVYVNHQIEKAGKALWIGLILFAASLICWFIEKYVPGFFRKSSAQDTDKNFTNKNAEKTFIR
jgi:hypothetical protein